METRISDDLSTIKDMLDNKCDEDYPCLLGWAIEHDDGLSEEIMQLFLIQFVLKIMLISLKKLANPHKHWKKRTSAIFSLRSFFAGLPGFEPGNDGVRVLFFPFIDPFFSIVTGLSGYP